MKLLNSKIFGGGNFLRITLTAGLILFVFASLALSVFYLIERSASKTTRQKDSFARALHEYDMQLSEMTGTQREFERLDRELDKIEKTAIGVESWLSILKRRRHLARVYPPSAENYRKSINRALETYPMSQSIAALASESMIKNTAIDRETEQIIRGWLPLFTDPLFNKLRLGLHVLLGDFRNPQRADVIPSELNSDGTEEITLNLTILKIIRSDIRGAASDIQTMLYSSPGENSIRLAAEFFYDFGDMERSAELFSLLKDEKYLIRQADALYLASYTQSAKSIWYILSNSSNPQSLYNLGVTSEQSDEAAALFEKLVSIETADHDVRQYALIRYSRLLETAKAVALLQNTKGFPVSENPFLDLEICRRQAQMWELGRQIAEAWLLLDRHEGNKDMYRWAAWLILFQRNYIEIKILLDRMESLQFTDQWVKIYKAIQLMFDGELDRAEDILRSIPDQEAEWTVHANLARIIEAQLSHRRALEQYEYAMNKNQNPKTAARIQVRIARCFSALNRQSEAYAALLYALALDPENLTARLEIDRLSY